MESKKETPANITFFIIFILFLVLNIFLFWPYFHTLAFAAIVSGTFYPYFSDFNKRSKLSRTWTSLIGAIAILLIILVPLAFIIIQVSREAVGLYTHLSSVLTADSLQDFFFGDGFVATLNKKAMDILNIEMTRDQAIQMALEKVKVYSGFALKMMNNIVGDTLFFIFHFFIMVFAVYGIFLYGEDLKNYIFTLSPLPDEQEEKILSKFNQMNFVTMVGNGVGGIIQGGLAGIAFWALGIPSVFLWTTVMVILAFIPLVGISFITIPTAIYLMISGRIVQGLFLIIFSAVVSMVVENWFKPKFIGERIQINGLLVFFYILAGMSTFGMAGIFYGPLLCIIFVTLADLFTEDYVQKFTNAN